MEIKIKLNGGVMPKKATEGAAAYDLYVPEDVKLTGARQIIDMKFAIALPTGYAATIQPRSGFSAKGIEIEEQYKGCDGATHTEISRVESDVVRGLIDSDYRGDVGVILNHKFIAPTGNLRYIIKKGTRIAQMQIIEVPQVELVEVEELSDTDRGQGGFGSTGSL